MPEGILVHSKVQSGDDVCDLVEMNAKEGEQLLNPVVGEFVAEVTQAQHNEILQLKAGQAGYLTAKTFTAFKAGVEKSNNLFKKKG